MSKDLDPESRRFYIMNYTRIYDSIINKAKLQKRVKNDGIYYESHHIIPRCLGGANTKDNVVLLTAREHFLCHWLLCRANPLNSKLAHAFHMMCVTKGTLQNRYTPSSRTIMEAKQAHAKHTSNRVKGVTNPMYGRKRPDLSAYNSSTKKGVPNGKRGVPKPQISGELHPMYGKQHTLDSRLKMSASKKGIKQTQLTCPHCSVVGGSSNMKRYHFTNCKKLVGI